MGLFLKRAIASSVCSVLSKFVRWASVRRAFRYVSIVRGLLAFLSRYRMTVESLVFGR